MFYLWLWINSYRFDWELGWFNFGCILSSRILSISSDMPVRIRAASMSPHKSTYGCFKSQPTVIFNWDYWAFNISKCWLTPGCPLCKPTQNRCTCTPGRREKLLRSSSGPGPQWCPMCQRHRAHDFEGPMFFTCIRILVYCRGISRVLMRALGCCIAGHAVLPPGLQSALRC